MELPKYHETFIPILEILNKVDSLKSRELASQVRDRYYSDLPRELLNQKTSSGANVLLDRILWGKSKSGDGGIDGIINEDKLGLEKIYTQAKRYNESKVREKDIRNFIGAMSGDTNKGVFITTSTFDDSAIKKAREAHHSIILINGAKLVDLMHQGSAKNNFPI
jgi:predicted Mrr-cat superfamily restriction endonuclease